MSACSIRVCTEGPLWCSCPVTIIYRISLAGRMMCGLAATCTHAALPLRRPLLLVTLPCTYASAVV